MQRIVILSLANDVNQLVSMDLKDLIAGKVWILHLIDETLRYSAAGLINKKKIFLLRYFIYRLAILIFQKSVLVIMVKNLLMMADKGMSQDVTDVIWREI